jgi:uncharacterized protein YecT (DUF1311 family)
MSRSRIHRLSASLAAVLTLAAATLSAAAAEKPSFDCATAHNARETAVCLSDRLARADRAMAAAYGGAKARFGEAGGKALVDDQRRFLELLDFGFERALWNKDEPTAIRAVVKAALADRGSYAAVPVLTRHLEERVALLKAARPAASRLTGTWKTYSSVLTLESTADGRFKARFDWDTYGYPRDHCGFSAVFHEENGALVSTEQDGDDDYAPGNGRLTLSLADGMLHLSDAEEDGGRACGRDPELRRTFFQTQSR